jgi:carnitine-CoA ligase
MGFLPDRSEVVLRHILEKHAGETPDREFLLFENGEIWTYQRALSEAYKAANVLAEKGIGRGENVLIFLPDNEQWLWVWWGLAILGTLLAPVNPAYNWERSH